MPIRPPMPPPCASSRCGACAIRPSWRPGTRRAAPTACSSTSRAARISSAARRQLLADLAQRLRAFGLYPRLAIADTAGAAWAMARHGPVRPAEARIVPPGEEARRAPRPAACRAPALGRPRSPSCAGSASGASASSCRQPRAPFAARFEPEVLQPPRPGAGARARAARSCRGAARLSRARHVPRADPEPRSTCWRPPRGCCGSWPRTWRAMPSARASCACCCSEWTGRCSRSTSGSPRRAGMPSTSPS